LTTERTRISDHVLFRYVNVRVQSTWTRADKFMRAGGSVLALGDSAAITGALEIQVQTEITETVDGVTKPASRAHFYIPGSLVNAVADDTDPLAFAMPIARAWQLQDRSDAARRFPSAPV